MPLEKIIVTNITYPERSRKYGHLVCVGGITEDTQEWRRLYPIVADLFFNNQYSRFHKWDIIEVKVEKLPNNKDPRKESYRVINWREIKQVGHIKDWNERRKIVDKQVVQGMNVLVQKQYEDWTSMGVIKPKLIKGFLEKDRHRVTNEGDLRVLEVMETLTYYMETCPKLKFQPDTINKWIGYDFLCYEDKCNGHTMMVNDWECQELYRRKGFEKTKEKYYDWMLNNRDLYFMMGTVARKHTWIIVGVFYPPKIKDESLDKYIG